MAHRIRRMLLTATLRQPVEIQTAPLPNGEWAG